MPNRLLSSYKNQSGFTLIELLVAAVIVTFLAVAALPQIQTFMVRSKVGPGTSELQRGVSRMKANAEGNGATPYTSASSAEFSNLMQGGSVFTVAGEGAAATTTHSLAGWGSGSVVVEPGTIAALGDAFTVTLSHVNRAACPDMAATMQNSSALIAINDVIVKPLGDRYDGAAATNACNTTNADNNTFVFTVQ